MQSYMKFLLVVYILNEFEWVLSFRCHCHLVEYPNMPLHLRIWELSISSAHTCVVLDSVIDIRPFTYDSLEIWAKCRSAPVASLATKDTRSACRLPHDVV